ncbi:hypothetical protein PYCC9005_005700 [Savitreella phatthalungensis]
MEQQHKRGLGTLIVASKMLGDTSDVVGDLHDALNVSSDEMDIQRIETLETQLRITMNRPQLTAWIRKASITEVLAMRETCMRVVALCSKNRTEKIRARKTRKNVLAVDHDVKMRVLLLKEWYLEHLDHPYPSSSVKARLVEQSGMSYAQLNTWFINARRRSADGRRFVGELARAPVASLVRHPDTSRHALLCKAIRPAHAASGV